MKKFTKIIVVALCIIMVFSVASTAFADGTFSTGFTAGQTFNKIRDYFVQDDNVKASRNYNSHILLDGSAVKSQTVSSGGSNIYGSNAQGVAGLRVTSVSGASTKVKGLLFIWGGSTAREITDWTNYWGSWDF